MQLGELAINLGGNGTSTLIRVLVGTWFAYYSVNCEIPRNKKRSQCDKQNVETLYRQSETK